MTKDGPLRLGIVGCANIAKKQAITLAKLGPSWVVVTAVASRSKDKAQAFVQDYVGNPSSVQIFSGETGYDDLLASVDVDAVYLPLPTTTHVEWVHKAISNGKHVLLEKPVAVNATDFANMMEASAERDVFLMDGTMFVHHQRTQGIANAIQNGDVGSVSRVEAAFTFLGDKYMLENDIRYRQDGDPLGCIGDLGWYCIRLAMVAFRGGKPTSAQAVDWTLNSAGVPLDATCLVRFASGEANGLLTFHCGFLTPSRQTATICGDKLSLRIDDFVLPREAPLEYELHSMDQTENALISLIDKKVVHTKGPDTVQEMAMWQTFVTECSKSGGPKSTAHAQVSLANQQVVDALMESIAKGGEAVRLP